jgi:hypothetical protein
LNTKNIFTSFGYFPTRAFLVIKYKNLDYSVFSDESPQNLGGLPF